MVLRWEDPRHRLVADAGQCLNQALDAIDSTGEARYSQRFFEELGVKLTGLPARTGVAYSGRALSTPCCPIPRWWWTHANLVPDVSVITQRRHVEHTPATGAVFARVETADDTAGECYVRSAGRKPSCVRSVPLERWKAVCLVQELQPEVVHQLEKLQALRA